MNFFRQVFKFHLSPKCISIIRYLSESNDRVPLETHSKIIEKLNYPQLLVELLDNDCPWIKQGIDTTITFVKVVRC